MTRSAVDFPTRTRVHMGLAVTDLEASRRFYELLLSMPPTKTREGYVKFESVDPPINLTLSPSDGAATSGRQVTHFGIQLKSTEAVAEQWTRLAGLGLNPRKEESVNCCYATQDKVWVSDPDGNDWEVFVVTDADAPSKACAPQTGQCGAGESVGPCC